MCWFNSIGIKMGDPVQIKETVMIDHKKSLRKSSEGAVSLNSSCTSVGECSLAKRRKRISVEV